MFCKTKISEKKLNVEYGGEVTGLDLTAKTRKSLETQALVFMVITTCLAGKNEECVIPQVIACMDSTLGVLEPKTGLFWPVVSVPVPLMTSCPTTRGHKLWRKSLFPFYRS